MKAWPFLWVAAALASGASGAPAAAAPGGLYLASIDGIRLDPNEFVDGFTIDTWGVEIVAICHLPPGWEIRAGRAASPDGVIAGEASHGVTFLNRARLVQLRDLALVRLSEDPPRRREDRSRGSILPATFAGRVGIGRYGVDERRR